MNTSSLWNVHAGREIDTTPLADSTPPRRLVACLNVWNDVNALRESVRLWKDFVDHVIVVDGSYNTTGSVLSTDGTREFLSASLKSVEFIDLPGVSQCEKRTAYLQRGRVGDYLFIIDADERVSNGDALRSLPVCDVGWVRVRSQLYAHEYGQPRIIRWQSDLYYSGRHHWMYKDNRVLCTHQYGGAGFMHRPVNLTLTNERLKGRSSERLSVKREHLSSQLSTEHALRAMPRSVMSDAAIGSREALHILNYAYRDDGIAPSRFHTAINRTTPHSSVLFKSRPGPFGVPTQYDAKAHQIKLREAIASADLVHIHTVVSMAVPLTRPVPLVLHHHGSLLRANAKDYTAEARRRGALVLVSNLELLSWTEDYPAFFLPNVVPVSRYLQLRQQRGSVFPVHNTFRVAHSPTFHARKGTNEFLAACQRLQEKGYPIEPVLIENTSHAETLAIKATCHAAFDSFWLGIQCSGLEAAAMHLPVIAGDDTVASRYAEYFGSVPYTFANNGASLEDALRLYMDNPEFREAEADRVFEYVVANHDESAVALTYLDYVDTAFYWRSARRRATLARKAFA